MADVALTAEQVGQVVTYIAPGFFARLGYRTRYPSVDSPPGEVLIVSAVLSLPLVALAGLVLSGTQKPTQLGYVVLLLAGSGALGYVVAWLRGTKKVKRWLGRLLDYRIQPEGSIYAQTLKQLPADSPVTIELKDGRLVSGTPRNGPERKDDGINELYLTNPAVPAGREHGWSEVGAGIIIPLAEIANIVLAEDPTGASETQPTSVDESTRRRTMTC